MSYILDALTRSDQERQRGTVPDLHTVHAPLEAEPIRDSRWAYVAAAALLSGALVSAAWIYARRAPSPDQPGPPAARQQHEAKPVDRGNKASAVSPVAAPPVAKQQREPIEVEHEKMASAMNAGASLRAAGADRPSADTPQERVRKNGLAPQPRAAAPDEGRRVVARKSPPESDSKRSPAASLIPSDNVLEAVSPQERVQESGPAPQPRAVTPSDRQRRVARRSIPAADAKGSPDATLSAPQPVPVASVPAVASRERTVPTPPSDQRVLNLSELPSNLQRELPPISISGYARSSDPKDRMVIINERVVQEGEELAAGLKVEQIAPHGVTFSYKGYRFRMQ